MNAFTPRGIAKKVIGKWGSGFQTDPPLLSQAMSKTIPPTMDEPPPAGNSVPQAEEVQPLVTSDVLMFNINILLSSLPVWSLSRPWLAEIDKMLSSSLESETLTSAGLITT